MIVSVSCYVGVGFVVAALCYTALRCLTDWVAGGRGSGGKGFFIKKTRPHHHGCRF